MASLRNAMPRREHKERSQPAARRKLGMLEKKKDYTLRAKDFNKKKDRITKMKLKAAFRNPDEYYHKMNNTRTKNGVHQMDQDSGIPMTVDEAKIMKTQNKAYVSMRYAMDKKKAEKLQEGLHFIGAKANSAHTIFFDDEDDLDRFEAAPHEHFDTAPELLDNAHNRVRSAVLAHGIDSLAGMDTTEEDAHAEKRELVRRRKNKKRSAGQYLELKERLTRAKKMKSIASKLELQKNLMGKGKRKKIKEQQGNVPAVFKWSRDRKK